MCPLCTTPLCLLIEDLFDDRYGAPGHYSIYQCSKCGFGRIRPALKEKEIGQFYAKYYPLSSATPQSVINSVQHMSQLRAWWLGVDSVAHHYIKPMESVLDIGSASGVSLLEIEKLGGKAYGVEPDPTADKIAKKLGLRVFTGFITDNPFPKIKFDAITASQVVEHTPDPIMFLKSVHTKLKDGGYVVLTFPNLDACYRRIWGRYWIHWHVPYHFNFFTRKSFITLANQAGFRVVKIRTITPNLWSAIQLQMFVHKAKIGKMHPLWAKQHAGRIKNGKKISFFERLFQFILMRIFLIIVAPLNRFIDFLGQGESFIVWLKKDD